MTGEGRIDSGAYRRLLEHHLAQGSDGLVIGGTTGESPTLEPTELVELTRSAVELARGRIPVIAGSGTHSTAHSVELTRQVCAAGADACLVVTPYYNRPTQDGLRLHYEAVADAATAPVIMYNVPSRTGCDLLPATIETLAAHPRIVAVKEATGSVARTREILERCGSLIDVLSGDDATAVDLMLAGARGVISVTANIAPAQMVAVCRAALRADEDGARQIDARLQPLHRVLFVEPNPIPVKYALHRLGWIGATLRLPLTPLREENEAAIGAAMIEAGLEEVN